MREDPNFGESLEAWYDLPPRQAPKELQGFVRAFQQAADRLLEAQATLREERADVQAEAP